MCGRLKGLHSDPQGTRSSPGQRIAPQRPISASGEDGIGVAHRVPCGFHLEWNLKKNPLAATTFQVALRPMEPSRRPIPATSYFTLRIIFFKIILDKGRLAATNGAVLAWRVLPKCAVAQLRRPSLNGLPNRVSILGLGLPGWSGVGPHSGPPALQCTSSAFNRSSISCRWNMCCMKRTSSRNMSRKKSIHATSMLSLSGLGPSRSPWRG